MLTSSPLLYSFHASDTVIEIYNTNYFPFFVCLLVHSSLIYRLSFLHLF